MRPSVTRAWTCGCQLPNEPKVWIEDDHARQRVTPTQQLPAPGRGGSRRRPSGEQRQQATIALEEPAQRLGHREDHVPVRHGQQDDLDQELAQERRALGLAVRVRFQPSQGEVLRQFCNSVQDAAVTPTWRPPQEVGGRHGLLPG